MVKIPHICIEVEKQKNALFQWLSNLFSPENKLSPQVKELLDKVREIDKLPEEQRNKAIEEVQKEWKEKIENRFEVNLDELTRNIACDIVDLLLGKLKYTKDLWTTIKAIDGLFGNNDDIQGAIKGALTLLDPPEIAKFIWDAEKAGKLGERYGGYIYQALGVQFGENLGITPERINNYVSGRGDLWGVPGEILIKADIIYCNEYYKNYGMIQIQHLPGVNLPFNIQEWIEKAIKDIGQVVK